MSLRARKLRFFTASPGLQKHKRARPQTYEPDLLVWISLLETVLRALQASGFLGTLASGLLNYTRICELPKTSEGSFMCVVGRTETCYAKQILEIAMLLGLWAR